jgi:hypothetical protein
MDIYRKLLLLIIVVICIIIILNLLKQRSDIYNKMETNELKEIEPFSLIDMNEKRLMDNDVKSIAIDPKRFPNTIKNIPEKLLDLSLNQFCIKGSANSAYSGNFISDTMVQYVLSRGCRALDFEIYMDGEQKPIIGYSPDPTAINSSSRYVLNKKPVYFSNMMNKIISYAFNSTYGSTYTTPNKDDPLFINIRIKTDKNNKEILFNLIQDDISRLYAKFQSYFYYDTSPNGKSTLFKYIDPVSVKIGELKRKIIIIFEKEASGGILESNMSSMYKYNLLSNSTLSTKYYYQLYPNSFSSSPPTTTGSNTVSLKDPTQFVMVLPDTNKGSQPNLNIFSSIQNYGYQMNMFQYNVNDMLLVENEDIFNTYNGGIIPISYCLSYTSNYSTTDKVNPGVNTVFPTAFSGITNDTWLPPE